MNVGISPPFTGEELYDIGFSGLWQLLVETETKGYNCRRSMKELKYVHSNYGHDNMILIHTIYNYHFPHRSVNFSKSNITKMG